MTYAAAHEKELPDRSHRSRVGCLKPHVPPANKRGRPGLHNLREILDTVFYVLRSGCRLNTELRERPRASLGRDIHPSAGIVDSQSAKPAGVRGEHRGYDCGKKVRGRKRHLLVDTEGLVLEGASDRLPCLSHLWVDAGYRGRGEEWAEQAFGLGVEVLPRRWIVERTFAWICHNRRMSKDYGRLCATGEAFVFAAMVRRLARAS